MRGPLQSPAERSTSAERCRPLCSNITHGMPSCEAQQSWYDAPYVERLKKASTHTPSSVWQRSQRKRLNCRCPSAQERRLGAACAALLRPSALREAHAASSTRAAAAAGSTATRMPGRCCGPGMRATSRRRRRRRAPTERAAATGRSGSSTATCQDLGGHAAAGTLPLRSSSIIVARRHILDISAPVAPAPRLRSDPRSS